METKTINLSLNIPKINFSSWELTEFKVKTEFNPKNNSFKFRCKIPIHIYNVILESDESLSEGNFNQNLSDISLNGLLETLNSYFNQAKEIYDMQHTVEEFIKLIAFSFNTNHAQKKDNFNFADMGFKTESSIQYFILDKILEPKNSLNRYIYRTTKRIDSEFSTNYGKNRKWHYYGANALNGFHLIPWTEEREKFLENLQNKFVELNENLSTFLTSLDENKLDMLINNNSLKLLS